MTTYDGEAKRFYGKYRGMVVNNIDPMQRGRLLVQVPDVVGLLPVELGDAVRAARRPDRAPMGVYLVPPIGAGVWVEFEQGDPTKPIWVGCCWGMRGRRAARSRCAGAAGVAEHLLQTTRAEHR